MLTGRRLGDYEIQSLISAGGMGEVYRARDTKLGRDVAIKILPSAFAADPDRLARFEREARMLAALNHPHIAAIYGMEEADGIGALVLELVEGPTLAEVIAGTTDAGRPPVRPEESEGGTPHQGRSGSAARKVRCGGLALNDALRLARQIADALDAAHEKGIIHRDLKPANVKITHDGTVKVLDFGLAKLEPAAAAAETGPDMSITIAGTREGVVLGTAAYMSPEQARGRPVDKRTDIWAFGCVLYEMLTGRVAFSGETTSDTIAAVLEREPDWKSLRSAAVPPRIERLLQRCLEKDPRQRLRDIGDIAIELDDVLQAGASSRATRTARRSAGMLVAAALLAATASGAYWWLAQRAAARRVDTTPHLVFAQITALPGIEWFPSLSPDGKWVVYGSDSSGNRDIYLQSVTGQNSINLTKDSPDDDDQPAFSPDGEQIAFRSEREGGGLFVMGRTGEAIRRVTRAGYRPAWSPDGSELAYTTRTIDVNPQNGTGQSELWIVSLSSGKARRVGALDNAVQASWSPGGGRFAVAVQASGSRQEDIVTIAADGGESTPLLSDSSIDWNPAWSPDGRYLYFSSDRGGSMNLWRVAIDERSGRPLGPPEPVTTPAPFAAHPSLSADGRHIVYSSVLITSNVARLSIDSASASIVGDPVGVTSGSRPWANPDPSPDGQWLTFYSRQNPEGHVYVARSDGTGLRQLTGDSFIDRVPRWSPDGKWITFFSNRSSPTYRLWKIHPDGSELTLLTEYGAIYATWSADASRIAASVVASETRKAATYVVDPNVPPAQQKPEMLPPFNPPAGVFVVNSWSFDGEKLAGQTSLAATGIATYSFRTRRYDVLTDFGEFPIWLPDGRRLLFVSGGTEFIVIDSRTKQRRTIFTDTRSVLGPPRLTRDARTLYFSRRMTESDLWLATIPDDRQ